MALRRHGAKTASNDSAAAMDVARVPKIHANAAKVISAEAIGTAATIKIGVGSVGDVRTDPRAKTPRALETGSPERIVRSASPSRGADVMTSPGARTPPGLEIGDPERIVRSASPGHGADVMTSPGARTPRERETGSPERIVRSASPGRRPSSRNTGLPIGVRVSRHRPSPMRVRAEKRYPNRNASLGAIGLN